jgi:hypothetical protein
MRLWIALLLTLPLVSAAEARPRAHAAGGGEKSCKKAVTLTGACRMVKGSLGLTQGLGVTLNADDGTKILIKAPADTNADIAPNVMQNWLYWQSQTNSMQTRILGTFEVCPLPPALNPAGIKDSACINNATRITVDKSTVPAK